MEEHLAGESVVWRVQGRKLAHQLEDVSVAGEEILHAINHAITADEVGDDPVRWLVLGPDRAGNLLELVVMDRPAGPAVIHAMQMRNLIPAAAPEGQARDSHSPHALEEWLAGGWVRVAGSGRAAGAPSASPSTCVIRSGLNAIPGPDI